jgi:hypothetical protein
MSAQRFKAHFPGNFNWESDIGYLVNALGGEFEIFEKKIVGIEHSIDLLSGTILNLGEDKVREKDTSISNLHMASLEDEVKLLQRQIVSVVEERIRILAGFENYDKYSFTQMVKAYQRFYLQTDGERFPSSVFVMTKTNVDRFVAAVRAFFPDLPTKQDDILSALKKLSKFAKDTKDKGNVVAHDELIDLQTLKSKLPSEAPIFVWTNGLEATKLKNKRFQGVDILQSLCEDF